MSFCFIRRFLVVLGKLVPIEAADEKRDISLNCEHNSENLKSKPSEKRLIVAVEGKDLNEVTIHELVEMMQQAVKCL